MTARLLERVRAFQALAEFIPEERRTEIATALADELSPSKRSGSATARPAVPEPVAPPVDPITEFLVAEGFEGPGLVRAAVRLRVAWVEDRQSLPDAYAAISDLLEPHRA